MEVERFTMPSKTVPDFDVIYMRDARGPGYKNEHLKWPAFQTETIELKKGSQKQPGNRPLVCDIIYKKDQPILLSDGTTLYADLYCPADEGKQYPIVLVWTGYGKIDPPNNYKVYFNDAEMKDKYSCGYNTFEGPEPDYWVSNGYIVAVVDVRGNTYSEGVFNHTGKQEAHDIYEVIEWLGVQPYSNGKVGMIGNSQLANSQYNVAALNPPHLAAIAPWEACNDWYNDQICRGGIPFVGLFGEIINMLRVPNGIEDVKAMLEKYPLCDNDYWNYEKRTSLDQIKVPMYLVASWTSNVHPYGTLRAWKKVSSEEKWLRIHNTQEWPDQQTPKYRDELRDFYDHYLKGLDNGWEKTPKARVSILDPTGADDVDVEVPDFPLPDTRYIKLYLDAASHRLGYEEPADSSQVSYRCREVGTVPEDPISKKTYEEKYIEGDGLTQFRITFTEDTTLCGYFKGHFFVSTDEGNDMDLFMYVYKEDSIGIPMFPIVLGIDFVGAEARMRVSHREVENRDYYDWRHSHRKEELLEPGQIVDFETIFWPMGMRWRKGETLALTISSRELQLFEVPCPPIETRNKGIHTVYTGGTHPSYIEIPIVDL